MSASVADLFVVLDSVTDPFSNGMKRAAADAEAQSKRMSSALGAVTKVGLGLSVAVGGIAAASVKAASDFQQSMTKLYTAAGASKQAVLANQKAVLDLGTQTGYTGTQMAQALYLPVSAGFQMADALNIVKYAAEEAQISGANLTDTAYSLSSVMKAFNYPTTQAGQAMSDLNAIVGDGAMTFQDFNASVKNWAPTADTLGISLNSMGSALAYLTDRGNSAEEASTRLTMGLAMMVTPSKQAATLLEGMGVASSDVSAATGAMTEVLKKTGITQNQLAADLKKPDGIYVALTDLQDALHKAGIKGTEADSVISKIFGGGRSDKAIMSLLGNLDGLHQKFDQITADSTMSKFQANWDDTRKNFSFLMDQMKAGAQNLGIELGLHLIPQLSSFITTAEGAGSQIVSGFTGAATKPVAHDNLHNALLNQEAAAPPPLTGWQKFGETVHTVLTDIEDGAKRLEPVAQNFIRFGDDVWQSLGKIEHAAEPVAHDLGVTLFGGAELAGKAFANYLGPAIKDVANFIDAHQTTIRIFADVILGGLALKMGLLGTIKATAGLIDLATKIAQFPVNQVQQIGTAFGDLKTKASGALDKVLPDSGKLAGLAQVGKDLGGVENGISGVEKAAGQAEQLSLFETNLNGIVQVADHEQLALFATDIGTVGTEAQTAETAVGGLAGNIGKFAMAGGVIGVALVGIGLLANELSHLAGAGDHTGLSMDTLQSKLKLAGSGSVQARDQITQAATALAEASNVVHKPVQGLTDMDAALAQMVTSGNALQARDQFNAIATALAKQGTNAKTTAGDFPQYEQAIKDAGDAAQTMGGKVQAAMDTMQRQQSLDQFKSDVDSLTQSIKDNGGALAGNTTAATQNIDAFRNMALESLQFYQDQINSHAPMDQVNRDLANQYNQLEQVGIQFLGSKKKADDFLTTLGMIKPQYDTSINLDTSHAVSTFNGLLETINSSTATVHVSVSQTGLGMSTSRGAATPGYDGGGWVSAPRGRAQFAVVHGGEYVLSSDMLAGRQPVDPKILSGAGLRSGSGYSGAGGGGAPSVVNNYVVNFAGSLMTEDEALRKLRTAQLQWSQRNGGSGWSVP